MLRFSVYLILLQFSVVFSTTGTYPAICEEPTIFHCKHFHASEDAESIKRSLKYTYNAETTLQLLLNRANSQRQDISDYLKKRYDISLNAELDTLFPPITYTQKLLKALISEPKDFLAGSLYEAVTGLGTDEDVLIEILCSRKTNHEINGIKNAFKNSVYPPLTLLCNVLCNLILGYNQSLEQNVYDDTSGEFMNLLMDILHAARKPDSTPISDHSTRKLIKLIATSKGQNPLFESSVVTIFSRESFMQLYHVISNFSKIAGQTIHQCIEQMPRDPDYIKALLAIVDSVTNLPRYYAKRLYESMEGLGTDNQALIRIIAIRSEKDMGCIKREFEGLYGATLKSWIQDDTRGLFSEALVQLIEDKEPTNCTVYPIS